ncbi:MAG: DUF4335 domain-containing protein [Pseudanabaenaceae cyanobacterium bins.68]|nr:DUF4335 domain-containing protein [Pseudanabaenaceae cyanobacterium bins.68]
MKLRRSYHTPTAELEIWWQASVLDQWTDRPLTRDLGFCLKLKHQQIQGDRRQFSQLHQVVSQSTSQLLGQSQVESWDHTLSLDRSTTLKLSTLELFDLQTSLEQVEQDLTLLPEKSRFHLPIWSKAAIAITSCLGIGVLFIPRSPAPPPAPVLVLSPPPRPSVARVTPQRLPSFLGKIPKFPTGRPIRVLPRPVPPPSPPLVATIPASPPPPPPSEPPPSAPESKVQRDPVRPERSQTNLSRQPPVQLPSPPPKPQLLITSRVQFSDQILGRDQKIDLSFSLSQHLRRQLATDSSSKGEVEFQVNLQNGQVTQVQFDQSSLADPQLEQSIGAAIASWQPPNNPNGTARLIIRLW